MLQLVAATGDPFAEDGEGCEVGVEGQPLDLIPACTPAGELGVEPVE